MPLVPGHKKLHPERIAKMIVEDGFDLKGALVYLGFDPDGNARDLVNNPAFHAALLHHRSVRNIRLEEMIVHVAADIAGDADQNANTRLKAVTWLGDYLGIVKRPELPPTQETQAMGINALRQFIARADAVLNGPVIDVTDQNLVSLPNATDQNIEEIL